MSFQECLDLGSTQARIIQLPSSNGVDINFWSVIKKSVIKIYIALTNYSLIAGELLVGFAEFYVHFNF